MKTKKIISVLMIIAVVTSLCVVMTACNDSSITVDMNKTSSTFDVTSGKTYTINLTTYHDGVHEIIGYVSAGTATVEIQQKSQVAFSSWKTTEKITFKAGSNSRLVTIGTSDVMVQNNGTTQPMGNSCRILVTFNKNAKARIGWYEYCDNKEANFKKYNYYTWKCKTAPETDVYEYRTILYLNTKFSNALGNVLKNSSAKDAIRIFLDQKQMSTDKYNKMVEAISNAATGLNSTGREGLSQILGSALASIFSSAIQYATFSSEVKKVSNTLLNVKTPQRVAFSLGKDGAYHIETSDVLNVNGSYFLYGAMRHKGTFSA
ncbi:MAG: hypothetical protein ACI4MW_02350 [Christensenellales bacterium]